MTAAPVLLQGNEAVAEGAIAAGARFFAGYPITPSTEIAESLARRLPEVGGRFIQMEDEIASIAAVCGASLALMDAGVPVSDAVVGISVGLVSGSDGRKVFLTDILGSEDHFGDMDFKVAGTRDVVTALQLDTKIDGLPAEVLAKALRQARDARQIVLDVMEKAIARPAATVKPRV